MFDKPDVTGVLSADALASSFSAGTFSSRVLLAYRTYLEDSIENKFKVSCNIATSEHGPVHFNVNPDVKNRISEKELKAYEEECRAQFLDARKFETN